LNRISNATERARYRERIEAIERDKGILVSRKEKILSSINEEFFKKDKPWLILGFNDSIDAFSSKMELFIEHKAENKLKKKLDNQPNNFSTVLPDGSPDTVSLKRMLEDEKCYVCGRPAKKMSKEWQHIKNVKERPKEKIEQNKNDFSSFFGEIQMGVSGFYNTMDEIFEDIKQKRLRVRQIEEEIQAKDLEEKDATTKLMENGGVVGEDQKVSDQNDIVEFDAAKEKKRDSQSAINETKKAIANCKVEIKKVGEAIKNSNTGIIPEGYETNTVYLTDIEEIFYQAQVRVFDKVLSKMNDPAAEQRGITGIFSIRPKGQGTNPIEIRG